VEKSIMTVRPTSLAAYDALPLQRREAEVLTAVAAHFTGATFTRKELARAMGWEINRITGRVLTLIDRGEIEELAERRDGGYLLRLAAKQKELELA